MRSLKIFILVGMLLLTGVSAVLAMGNTGYIQDTLVGKPAADFTLNTVKGNKINLTQYRGGKKAIIFLWATWCPHCRVELKRINELQEKFLSQGIQPIIVSLGEEKNVVQNYLERHQYDFDVLLDEDQSLEESYQIVGVPTLFFVDEKGVIRHVDHALSDNYNELFGVK